MNMNHSYSMQHVLNSIWEIMNMMYVDDFIYLSYAISHENDKCPGPRSSQKLIKLHIRN